MTILLYTDGACKGNPGPGGWAYVLEYNGHRKMGADSVPNTTNQRMELYAVIKGLIAITDRTHPVKVVSDSNYVVRGMTEWITKWKANGWKTAKGDDVKNKSYWQALDDIVGKFNSVHFTWVKGHSGNEWNEYADEMAVTGARLAAINSIKPLLISVKLN